MYTLLLVAFTSIPLSSLAQGKASITEQNQSMVTYPYSDPNPVAKPESNIYPYFLFDGYSIKSVQQEWKTVVLENDYLRITIFPEIGGKLWGAFDKINNREFIYTNDAVKFRNIAMRGPWTSGGIEFNFGIIGHEPTTSSPVDYLTRENPDGSVSCFVGSYDLMTRNYWSVEVCLPKDKAYFMTKSTVYNTSSIDQPYYQWMNAAFAAQNNAQFTYPGNAYIGHVGELSDFPVDKEGRNIGFYDQNNFGGSKSYHVLGYLSDYFGIYWHGLDYGSIHHSTYDDKLGMKIFLWSQARDGGIWEDLLTDHHKQYIEMQSGRMFNQPQVESGYTPYKNNAIKAQTTDTWTEYWFPIQGTKGVAEVSPIGGLNVLRNGSDINLVFSPLANISTQIKLYNKDILVKTVDLKSETLKTWSQNFSSLNIPEGQLKVVIGDQELVYSEAKEDFELNRPKTHPKDFDWESVYGLYVKGEQMMNSLDYTNAEKTLKQSLDKDKYFAPALIRLASIYVHQAKYDQALALLQTVISLDAYSEEGNYLYGLCNLALGKTTDAKDGFSLATRSNSFRSPANEKLAEIYLKEGNIAKAIHYAENSLEYNVNNLNTLQLLSVVYRSTGKVAEAKKAVEKMLEIAPLYPASRFEAAKTGLSTIAEFTAVEQCEMPQETYMELASWYESIEQYDDAIELLDLAENSPMALIRKAYVQSKKGDKAAAETLSKALTLSPDFVFPFRVEDKPALEYAIANTSDWKPKYYLAELLLAKRDKVSAMKLLKDCGETNYANYYSLYASLVEGGERLEALKKAEAINPTWRVARDLMNYYQSQEDYANVIKTGEKYGKRFPQNYHIKLLLAKGYQSADNNVACLNLLKKTTILPYEGSREGYVVYRKANLAEAEKYRKAGNIKKAEYYEAEAEKYPENLGVGKPYPKEK